MSRIQNKLKELWLRFFYFFIRQQLVVTRAFLTGDGSFVAIRYRLTRPDKISPRTRCCLIHQNTGTRLEIMKLAKIGCIKTNHTTLAKNGNVLFWNRDNIVTPGSKVIFVMGNLKVDNIKTEKMLQ